MRAAEWTIRILALYLLAGAVFAIPFVTVGIARVDSAARHATLGFRVIVLPGVMALWPLLLIRWIRSSS